MRGKLDMCRKHSNDVVHHELLTFAPIHAACSTRISNLTISEVPQHATSVFSTFVQYITKKPEKTFTVFPRLNAPP